LVVAVETLQPMLGKTAMTIHVQAVSPYRAG
jgi:hypothetical protein